MPASEQVGPHPPPWHFATMIETEQTPSFAAGFAPASSADWRKLVDAVLKGSSFERLRSKTYDGFLVEPLYERSPSAQPIAGRKPGPPWTVMQRVDHPDPAAANAQALEDLENGATGLSLVFDGSVSAFGFGIDGTLEALTRALDGVELDAGITIDLSLSQLTRDAAKNFSSLVERRQGTMPASVDLHAGVNPIGGFASTGVSPLPWRELSHHFASLVGVLNASGFPGPHAVADGRIVHNAGGSEAQELAFVIATAVEYLRALEAHDVPLDVARRGIYFRLSADADQFLTMAKFRAARKLWARVQAACGLEPEPVVIAAETAWRMLSGRDPNVNMLRNTVAVAAAGLGGADMITVVPHTAPLGLPDGFARRVARNTQLVLIEESNLARVADPGAGSGALEALTQQLCEAAWSLFQEIESAGGVWAALERGLIQQKVATVRAERQRAIARRRDVLTGTNEYPNLRETTPQVLKVAPHPPAKSAAASVSAEALPRIRLAEPFEALRDASDQMLAVSGTRPKIFLATLGTPAEFTPRASFARNFFESGGIEAVGEFEAAVGEVEALAAAFKASATPLACLCSSDKIYQQDAEAAAQMLKAAGARCIYLAGRPGEREAALRAAGVQCFIYDGCDALATLQATYDSLGR
jgi:methylmalonyl-CoA mutase